jgi:hypothetical protein
MALKKPHCATKIIVEELKFQKISDYIKIFVGIFLETISNILALINLKKMESYLVWKQIRGTKMPTI